MVRAAASGAIDYTGADPLNRQWRIKHRLLLREVHRKEEENLLTNVHRHWCAYASHGRLSEESFDKVKEELANALVDLQGVVFPWARKEQEQKEDKNSKIDSTTQKLIDVWKSLPERKQDG